MDRRESTSASQPASQPASTPGVGERVLWALGVGALFSVLEAAVCLLWPPDGVAYGAADLLLSLGGWCTIAGLAVLLPKGRSVAAALLLALALPPLLGSAWWALPALLLGAAWPRLGLGLFGLLGLASGLEHSRTPLPRATHPELPDLVLITVDTLRADSGELLGMGTPLLATSAAPWTLPAMDSLMLGQSVIEHGGGLLQEQGISRPSGRRLAERLSERGYATAAWVCNPHLRASLGHAAGFDSYVHADSWRDPSLLRALLDERRQLWGGAVPRLWHARDAALAQSALAWWQSQAPGGRFLWIHLLGPHEFLRDPVAELPADSDKRQAYADAATRAGVQLAPLIQAFGPETRLLVVSDHGESLGEGGLWGHGSALVDEQLLVPVLAPGWSPPSGLGQLAAWELPGAVLLADPIGRHELLPVAGVRESSSQAAMRGPGGYSVVPIEPASQRYWQEPELMDALQALGYQSPGRDRESTPKADP